MKKITAIFFYLLFSLTLSAQVKLPAPSPTQTLKQDFGIGQISVKYSRPSAKGRKIFGDLVPFNKLWRTGANGATVISFSEPVEINGKKIDTGSYALYTIPGPDYWEVIFNKGAGNSGIVGYSESEDVIRFHVESKLMKSKMEMFTIEVNNISPQSCSIDLMWEKTIVSVPVLSNVSEKLKAQIEAAMLTDKKPYWQAAQYYNEYEKNNNKALENITQALGENPKAYYMWLYKARIQKDMGDKAGALESSKTSMALALAEKNEDYVRLNQAFQKKLK